MLNPKFFAQKCELNRQCELRKCELKRQVTVLGYTGKDIRPLHLVLNKAIRFIFNLGIRVHITPYYEKLHILTVDKRIRFKACLMGYKIFNGLSPSYLNEDFKHFEPTTTINLREGTGRDKAMFQRNFHRNERLTLFIRIKNEYNALPLHVRRSETLSMFKKKLKSFLIS